MKRALSRGLGYLVIVPVLGSLWYLWALFPVFAQPPGAGALFTKSPPIISKLAAELKANPSGKTPLSDAEINSACKPPFLLKPLEGPADHIVLQVTVRDVTVERNVSCSTHAYAGPLRKVP